MIRPVTSISIGPMPHPIFDNRFHFFHGSFGLTVTLKKKKFLNWSIIALQCVIIALNVAL